MLGSNVTEVGSSSVRFAFSVKDTPPIEECDVDKNWAQDTFLSGTQLSNCEL